MVNNGEQYVVEVDDEEDRVVAQREEVLFELYLVLQMQPPTKKWF